MISKLPHTGDSIFSVMTRLANQHQAINLAQGFPDFDPDPVLQRLVSKAMAESKNQYAPMPGLPALREQIALKTQRCYGYLPDADLNITVTAGATQALFTALQALVHAGDEVILLDPAYDAYAPSVVLAGGVPVHVPMGFANGNFFFDWEAIEKAMNPRTRLLLLNHPNNPAGTILAEADIQKLSTLMQRFPFLLLSDEVYEHMVFDNQPFLSVLRYEALRQRSVVVSSFGKTYHTTGWKMGYVVAPEALTVEFRKVHQFNVFSVNTPMQQAYAWFLESDRSYESLPQFYQQKRDLFLKSLAKSRFTFTPTPATYFQLADYSQIHAAEDLEFTRTLVATHKLSLIPVSPFFNDKIEHKLVRFCFAKSDELLQKAGEVICAI
ncbi:MAG: methionine aminotransferase [Sphingobacteriaceae bacterium]|nr:methionine aminotransferase [Sphingobacteriaceae bacterium]